MRRLFLTTARQKRGTFNTDEPKHARKYEKYVTHPQRKGYNSAGQLIMLEGDIDNGVVSIRKKSPLTEAQKQHLRELHRTLAF